MEEKERRFTFEKKDYVIKPITAEQSVEAQKVYNKAFKRAIEEGAILKKSLEDHMRRQGLWDDSKQAEYEELLKSSADIEYKIKSGFYKKASQLRDKGLELKKLRGDLASLMLVRNSMDANTADGQADNERFFYLISICVLDYTTQKPVYTSLRDYMEKAETPLAVYAAREYANFLYSLDDNYQDKLIENKLLKRLGLLNEKNELVNSEGHRVDAEGNLVDEDGSRIDAEGNRIDINNNPIIEDDVIDTLEFEDDLHKEPVPVEKTKPKRKRKTKTSNEETVSSEEVEA